MARGIVVGVCILIVVGCLVGMLARGHLSGDRITMALLTGAVFTLSSSIAFARGREGRRLESAGQGLVAALSLINIVLQVL